MLTATQTPVQMTRAQYQAKYGSPPPLATQPTQGQSQPISMTRAQYQQKYGVTVPAPTENTAPIAPTPPPLTDIPAQLAYSGNTMTNTAKNITNALGLGGTVDTFGSDIAAAENPDAVKGGELQVPSAEQNAGALLQTGAIAATPFIGPESILGNIGAGAGLGAAQQGGQAMTQNAPAQTVANQAGIGGILGGGASGIASGAGKVAEMAGNKISNTVIKPTAKDIADGFNTDTIQKYDLGGTLNQTAAKLKSLMSDLSSQLKAKLASSDSGIDLADVFDKTKADLQSPQGVIGNFGQNAGTARQLDSLQDEVLQANPTGKLSIPDAQIVKQQAGLNGEWIHGSADPDANAKETVYNTFYHNLKTSIEDNSPPGVQDINQQIQDLIPAQRAVARRIPVAQRNSGIGLRDMMGLLGIATGHLEAAIPLALEQASNSGLIGNALWKTAPFLKNAAPAAGLLGSGSTGLVNSSGLLAK